jgi:phytoene synthase
VVSPADLAACRALLRDGSRSFLLASRLLPRRVRDDAVALYAFCRVADDAIDEAGAGDSVATLRWLRERLTMVYAGRPMSIEADRALADLVVRRGIPMTLPAALLEGFAWDAEGRRYENLSELVSYAVRVAGSVGVMMALLMDARAPESVARACDLGVAMQLSNIARDVGEDARAGRLYLPLSWLREAGIDPEAWLACPVFNDAVGTVVRRLLDVAEALYRRADGGIASLPLACRPGIHTARLLYAEIGREVARRGFNGVSARAVVPVGRKLALLARGLATGAVPTRAATGASLPEAAYLMAAVADATVTASDPQVGFVARSRLRQRVVWLIELFTQLERRDRFGRVEP